MRVPLNSPLQFAVFFFLNMAVAVITKSPRTIFYQFRTLWEWLWAHKINFTDGLVTQFLLEWSCDDWLSGRGRQIRPSCTQKWLIVIVWLWRDWLTHLIDLWCTWQMARWYDRFGAVGHRGGTVSSATHPCGSMQSVAQHNQWNNIISHTTISLTEYSPPHFSNHKQ